MERNRGGRPSHPDILTPAEWRVLDELREGGTNAEIAVRLGLSPDTVKYHISNMLSKLGLEDRRQLAAWRPAAERSRLRALLALPLAFQSLARPLVWAGAGAVALAAVAAVVAVLVVVTGNGDQPLVVSPPPTETPQPTPSPTATATATVSPMPTTPTPTATAAPSPTAGATPRSTPTATSTPTRAEPVEPVPEPAPVTRPSLPASPTFDGPPGVYTDITVGASHACALTEANEAVCWDIGTVNVWDIPRGTYTFIEAERDETCAITDEGAIVCWASGGGPIPEGRQDPSGDAPPGRYQAFSWASDEYYLAGHTHACAVTDASEAVCWTSQEPWAASSYELALPELPPGEYTEVDVRYAFFGWGQESLTVCALTRTKSAVCSEAARAQGSVYPVSTWLLQSTYTSVAVSGRDSCALSAAGEIEGCGLWDSRTTRYVALSPGEKHVCAATDAGQLECWVHGSGWFVQGEVFVMDPPAPSSAGYVDVDVGHGYACALDETGRAICWGHRENKVAPPKAAPGRYVAVSDGLGHTCALTDTGEAACWGWNNIGQAAVPEGRYKAISAGVTGTCALTEADEMVCWGWSTYHHDFPPGNYRFITMAPDRPLTCAVSEAGAAACHGPRNFMEPVEFPGGPYRSVHVGWSADGDRICALSEEGKLVCRRSEDGAALSPPVDRSVVVSHGSGPLCFFTDGAEVVCWDATTAWSRVLPAGSYVALTTGPNHVCALTDAGEVHCRGSFGDQWSVDAPPGRYVAISSSQNRVCAVTEEGDVVCWGETDYGEPPASDPYW